MSIDFLKAWKSPVHGIKGPKMHSNQLNYVMFHHYKFYWAQIMGSEQLP